MSEEIQYTDINKSFEAAVERSKKIEEDLMKELPQDHWILWNLHIITFGREICFARNPKCAECPLRKYCNAVEE